MKDKRLFQCYIVHPEDYDFMLVRHQLWNSSVDILYVLFILQKKHKPRGQKVTLQV